VTGCVTVCVCVRERERERKPSLEGPRSRTSARPWLQIKTASGPNRLFSSLICTGARRNPATCGTNQGHWKRRFAAPLRAGGRCRSLLVEGRTSAPPSPQTPPEIAHPSHRFGEQIVFSNRFNLYHKSPDSGERQYKSRNQKRRFGPARRRLLAEGRAPERQHCHRRKYRLHAPSV